MTAPERLTASEQMVLSLACEAFSEATHRFRAEPRRLVRNRPDSSHPAIQFTVSGKQFDMPVIVAPNVGSHGAARVFGRRLREFPPTSERPLMLVTFHVTPKLAENLIANHIPFLDTAGNAYLEEPEATVMITGRDKPALKQTDTKSRSTTPKGLCVSFALATHSQLVDQPYRTIAHVSGVALNTVNLAVDDLIARRLVVKKNDRRMIADPQSFIKDWVSLYPTNLRTKLASRRYASGMGIDWWKRAPLTDFHARLGGECAAEALTHENKPVSVTVYAHGGTSPALMKAGRLRADPTGEVEIIEAFWPEHAEETWDTPTGIVHPLLVFADLLASGDSRNHAVAGVLYERLLDY